MEFHPIANIFPMMTPSEFNDLVADIDQHGQLQPIFTFKGQIIDGRNRFKACEKLNLVPACIEFEGDEKELVGFVISLNLKRRHLNESQRAMIAANLANMVRGDNQYKSRVEEISTTSQSQAASMLNVSRASVNHANVVKEKGVPALAEAVERGDVAVSAAVEFARSHTPEEQLEKISQAVDIKAAIKPVKAKEEVTERENKARDTSKINQNAKAFFNSFDRREARRRVGSIGLEIALIADRHPELDGEFKKVRDLINNVQMYLFPECNPGDDWIAKN